MSSGALDKKAQKIIDRRILENADRLTEIERNKRKERKAKKSEETAKLLDFLSMSGSVSDNMSGENMLPDVGEVKSSKKYLDVGETESNKKYLDTGE